MLTLTFSTSPPVVLQAAIDLQSSLSSFALQATLVAPKTGSLKIMDDLDSFFQSLTGINDFQWYGNNVDPVNQEKGLIYPLTIQPKQLGRQQEQSFLVAIGIYRSTIPDLLERLLELSDLIATRFAPGNPVCLDRRTVFLENLSISEPNKLTQQSHLSNMRGVTGVITATLTVQ